MDRIYANGEGITSQRSYRPAWSYVGAANANADSCVITLSCGIANAVTDHSGTCVGLWYPFEDGKCGSVIAVLLQFCCNFGRHVRFRVGKEFAN
mgnify:FL=1